MPHPNLVPLRFITSLRTHSRGMSPGTSTVVVFPLTFNVKGIAEVSLEKGDRSVEVVAVLDRHCPAKSKPLHDHGSGWIESNALERCDARVRDGWGRRGRASAVAGFARLASTVLDPGCLYTNDRTLARRRRRNCTALRRLAGRAHQGSAGARL